MGLENDLTIEKLNIVQQLTEIKTIVTGLASSQKEMHTALLGDGSEGRPGLIIDVDRLKQTAKSGVFHRNILYTGMTLGQLWTHFFKG